MLRGLGITEGIPLLDEENGETSSGVAGRGDSGEDDVRRGPELLAATATAALGVPIGFRSRSIGFVLEACRALLEAEGRGGDEPPAEGETRHTEVIKALEVRVGQGDGIRFVMLVSRLLLQINQTWTGF